MKAKLIKMVEGYTLSLTGSIDDLYGISNNQLAEEHQLQKISIKNCLSVENGYDLFELAYDSSKEFLIESTHSPSFTFGYEQGFQKALEIIVDKKFSEEDMINFAEYCKGDLMKTKDLFNEYQSLQQTEFDVEILMESNLHIGEVVDESYPKDFPIERPKLDADGCLILKRI